VTNKGVHFRAYNWHHCSAESAEHLQLVTKPAEKWNGGIPSWALVPGFVPIKYCPFCGERLPNLEVEDDSHKPTTD